MIYLQITIVDDCQMYIYIKNKSEHQHTGSLADVKCKILYDSQENLIGMEIVSKRSDTGQEIILPEIGAIEFPMHNAEIKQEKMES